MTTMKGLLKGLKYFQQIFENEEEEEFKIGFPTDVKHVAHIGWDGPSASAPSWMTEFKPTDGASSAPAGHGDAKEGGAPHGESVSEDSVRSAASARTCPSPARDVPDVPKSTRRHGHSSSTSDSPRAKGKTRHSRRASKGSLVDGSESNRELTGDGALGSESPMRNNPAPDVPKKSRRKKSKDSPVGGSARTSGRASKAQASSTSYDEPQFMDQDQPVRFKSAELGKASNMEAFEEREDKRISIVS